MVSNRIESTFEPFLFADLEAFFGELSDAVNQGKEHFEKNDFQQRYKSQRGLMVVAVVSSRQRSAQRVENQVLPSYHKQVGPQNLSLSYLANNLPTITGLMKTEPQTMKDVAGLLLEYGKANGIENEDEICHRWAQAAVLGTNLHQQMIDVKGIGFALLEYLRMLSGADTIKIDGQVKKSLKSLGMNTELLSDLGVYRLCLQIATHQYISAFELDQALWFKNALPVK